MPPVCLLTSKVWKKVLSEIGRGVELGPGVI